MMPFRYADLGEMLSLGDSAGAMSSLGLINLQGPLANLGRRAVYAARMPTSQQAVRAGLSWAVDSVVGAMRRGGAKG